MQWLGVGQHTVEVKQNRLVVRHRGDYRTSEFPAPLRAYDIIDPC
jgi:hypothetical protein